MNKQSSSVSQLLSQVPLTAGQRVRAEANMRQSEFLVDLMFSAFGAVASALGVLRSETKAKPGQRLGTAG